MRAWRALGGGVCLLLLGACATPKPPPPPAPTPEAAPPVAPPVAPPAAPKESVFVLLPEPGAAPGQVTVSNRGGTQVLDQPRQATRVQSADQAPSPPAPMDEAEVGRLFGGALGALPTEPAHFILYFRRNTDELTPESLTRLPEVFQSIRARRSTDVGVVGHTDSVGTREYNYQLALRRARRVAELLVARGAARDVLTVGSHGEDEPLVKTADEVPEPRNRRVEITVR